MLRTAATVAALAAVAFATSPPCRATMAASLTTKSSTTAMPEARRRAWPCSGSLCSGRGSSVRWSWLGSWSYGREGEGGGRRGGKCVCDDVYASLCVRSSVCIVVAYCCLLLCCCCLKLLLYLDAAVGFVVGSLVVGHIRQLVVGGVRLVDLEALARGAEQPAQNPARRC